MNKLKQTAKTILIFILCSATCFLSIGCGEDLTFEDGEYTTVLLVNPVATSWAETDFSVKIENGKLTIRDENYGNLSDGKISKKNLVDKDVINYDIFYDFDMNKLINQKKCLKSSVKNSICYYLMKCDNKQYLLRLGQFKENEEFKIIKIWELIR